MKYCENTCNFAILNTLSLLNCIYVYFQLFNYDENSSSTEYSAYAQVLVINFVLLKNYFK